MDINWFNLNPDFKRKVFGKNFKWFNCFRRVSNDGTYWGIGIIQIGKRHLLYIGYTGTAFMFFGTP